MTGRELQVALNLEGTGWMDDGLCKEVGGDFWFPDKGQPVRQARRVCAACPVRAECLEYALSWPGLPVDGIWGGTSKEQRRMLLRDRGNGRAA